MGPAAAFGMDAVRCGTGLWAMTVFQDMFDETAVEPMNDAFGQSVVYHRQDADDLTLTAIVGQVQVEAGSKDRGGQSKTRTVTVRISTDVNAVSGGIAEPKINDRLTVGSLAGGGLSFGETVTVKGVTLHGKRATLRCRLTATVKVSRVGR